MSEREKYKEFGCWLIIMAILVSVIHVGATLSREYMESKCLQTTNQTF